MSLQCLQLPRITCGRRQKPYENHSLQAYRWTSSLFICLDVCFFVCFIVLFFSHSLQSLPSFFHFSFPPLFNSFFLFCQFLPWSSIWTQFISSLQVYPRTIQLQICDLSIKQITFTPTIPARKLQYLGYPKFYFWLPDGVQAVNRQCQIELKGTTPVTLNIKATCPQNTQISTGLRAIVPQRLNIHDPFWFEAHLPTVWVRIQNTRTIKKETKNFKAVTDVFSSCHERGTKKNSEYPWGIEPQTFGFRALML